MEVAPPVHLQRRVRVLSGLFLFGQVTSLLLGNFSLFSVVWAVFLAAVYQVSVATG
jgi:hypothetical protein